MALAACQFGNVRATITLFSQFENFLQSDLGVDILVRSNDRMIGSVIDDSRKTARFSLNMGCVI